MPEDVSRAQAGTEPPKASYNPKNQVQPVARTFGRNLPALTVAEVADRAGLDRGIAFRLIATLAMPRARDLAAEPSDGARLPPGAIGVPAA